MELEHDIDPTIRLTVPVTLHDRELEALERLKVRLTKRPAQGWRSLAIREAVAWLDAYFKEGCTCRVVPGADGIIGGQDDCPVHGLQK